MAFPVWLFFSKHFKHGQDIKNYVRNQLLSHPSIDTKAASTAGGRYRSTLVSQRIRLIGHVASEGPVTSGSALWNIFKGPL